LVQMSVGILARVHFTDAMAAEICTLSLHDALPIHPVTVRLTHDEESDTYVFHRIQRSLVWEKKQADLLEELGLRRKDALFTNFVTADESGSIVDWLNTKQEQLLEKGFTITQTKSDRRIFIGKTSLEMAIEEGNDWFDVQAVAHF